MGLRLQLQCAAALRPGRGRNGGESYPGFARLPDLRNGSVGRVQHPRSDAIHRRRGANRYSRDHRNWGKLFVRRPRRLAVGAGKGWNNKLPSGCSAYTPSMATTWKAPRCSSPRRRRVRKTSSNRKVVSVGAAGFEPTTSCTQSRRATNCATPRLPPQATEGDG